MVNKYTRQFKREHSLIFKKKYSQGNTLRNRFLFLLQDALATFMVFDEDWSNRFNF